MIRSNQDLFTFRDVDAICITTNGFIKKSGAAVMGAGIAKQASNYWRFIEYRVGDDIRTFGNRVSCLTDVNEYGDIYIRNSSHIVPWHIFIFPTKPDNVVVSEDKMNIVLRQRSKFNPGDICPGFWAKASPELIDESARSLVMYVESMSMKKVALPRPGCGNGGLTWEEVCPILETYFDDRFIITSKGGDK